MNQEEQLNRKSLLLLIVLAYLFSVAVRMIWVYQVQDYPDFYWNGQLMINTNDGYTWASSAQKVLYGMHDYNPGIRGMWDNAIVFLTVLLVKLTPFSLETIILYMPALISSLVVIPIILIAYLYKEILWGFFAALLGAIVWSYYNRTMTGYYDTDMFSAMAPMFILYFLMKSTIDFNLRSALYAGIAIVIYPFLYDAGASIVNAMGILYAAYLIVYHRKEEITYYSIVLVFLSLVPFSFIDAPFSYIVKIIVLLIVYAVLKKNLISQKMAMILGGVLFLLFMYFGNVFGLILSKIAFYTTRGTATEGLHFYSVSQTIREAGTVLFFPLPEDMPYRANIAHRMMGSSMGLIISVVGYLLLIARHRAFLLALPLIGIGLFAHWGGLRFTVYAVPVAAMSAVYFFFFIGDFLKDDRMKYLLVTLATAAMIYPNIIHIISYKVPTVLNREEVADLTKLEKISNPKDYTMAWWDYGYPIWFYSNTNTIIDGGKHQNDNFIISKIMQTTSPELAANLSRLAVETYVDSNYSTIADTLFKNEKKDQIDPNIFLEELASDSYKLPPKTRDIYLYMPYKMLDIFPTVSVFGNLDLTSGQAERRIIFYPANIVQNNNGAIALSNGIVFDSRKGLLAMGKEAVPIKQFIITMRNKDGTTDVKSQAYHSEGEYIVVYMQNYGKVIVMDQQTFHSMYVQMFILGKYDKKLFEPVVSSLHTKIYRLKR